MPLYKVLQCHRENSAYNNTSTQGNRTLQRVDRTPGPHGRAPRMPRWRTTSRASGRTGEQDRTAPPCTLHHTTTGTMPNPLRGHPHARRGGEVWQARTTPTRTPYHHKALPHTMTVKCPLPERRDEADETRMHRTTPCTAVPCCTAATTQNCGTVPLLCQYCTIHNPTARPTDNARQKNNRQTIY